MTEEKKKILIVEDDIIIARAMREEAEDAGLIVLTAVDGDIGIDAAHAEMPDLILLDLVMPKKDGFETLKEIKGDEALKNIPVLVVSNLSHPDDVRKANDLGVVGYLEKSSNTVEEIVKKAMEFIG